MTIEEYFKDFGQRKVAEIRTALRVNNINASGKLSESITDKVESTPQSIRLIVDALAYIATVDIGRAPTKKRTGDFTVQKIKDWIIAKRLQVPAKMTLDQFAFVVWRKINREGTLQFRSGARSLVSDAIESGLSDFEQGLTNFVLSDVDIFLAKWQRL